ncbi:MAG: hypothetical protein KGL18_05370, partial [Burkholderiales bacterium]|nr:hypothetical protein [Burkholderiales bacterium]
MAADPPSAAGLRRLDWLPWLLLCAAIVALTALALAHERQQRRARESAELESVSVLRTRLVADWLQNQTAQAEFARTSELWARQLLAWRSHGDAAALAALLARIGESRRVTG